MKGRAVLRRTGLAHEHLIPEAIGEVQNKAKKEGEADAEPCILQGVELFEPQWVVNPDEAVDRHANNDVHGGDHEGVDQGNHDVSLPKDIFKWL